MYESCGLGEVMGNKGQLYEPFWPALSSSRSHSFRKNKWQNYKRFVTNSQRVCAKFRNQGIKISSVFFGVSNQNKSLSLGTEWNCTHGF